MTHYPIPYCLPLQCARKEHVLKAIDENRHLYRYFEVWLGAIENLDDGFLGLLAPLYEDSLVVLFRSKNLEIPLTKEQRRFFIKELSGTKAYLDLDIIKQREDIEYLVNSKMPIRTILSYHNYESTPSHSELKAIADEMVTFGGEILKFSTKCLSPQDAALLLHLQCTLQAEGRRCIVLGMGEHGVATRVFGTMWGNEIVFAPRDRAHASAPGQFTRDELESVIHSLRAATRAE